MARITGIVAGHLTAPAGIWREGDPLDEQVRIPVPCYLIESGSERILIDTGLHPQAGVDRYGPAAAAMQWEPLAEPLPEDPSMVVMTHLHFDHAGGLGGFDGVDVVVQRAEWEAAHDPSLIERVMYTPMDIQDIRPTLVDGETDLLGDGSVILCPTPGHTPGHQSVMVSLDDGGRVLVAADACYFPENLDSEKSPPYGWDKARELESLRWVREERDRGVRVLCGHDPSAGTIRA
jgi:glyoxylase-like metal-dependent hydrolase (beta-lactamase superfamily II)